MSELLLGQPESALPPLVIEDCGEEVFFFKVRPESVGEIELCIRGLPEKKVADAFFTARADNEIGVGQSRGIEIRRKHFLGKRAGCSVRRAHALDRLQDLSP